MLTRYHAAGDARAISATKQPFWIDLLQPTPAEMQHVAAEFHINVPTRDALKQIESSSRLRVEDEVLYLSMALAEGMVDFSADVLETTASISTTARCARLLTAGSTRRNSAVCCCLAMSLVPSNISRRSWPLDQETLISRCGSSFICEPVVLLIAASLDWRLGLPTFLAGMITGIVISALRRAASWSTLKQISWTVLPLVAGLFVLVQGVEGTGVLQPLIHAMSASTQSSPDKTALFAGGIVAFLCNAMNNLPLGLIVGAVASGAHVAPSVTGALLVGVDLGPILSVTGSLATILWLVALRREGQDVSAWKFLLVGIVVMPPALLAALTSFVWLAIR